MFSLLSKSESAAIERRFAELRLHSNDERFSFSGANATVVFDFDRRFDIEVEGGVCLTRLCKNPRGEYFHIIVLGKDQHVKHLSKSRASLILQGHPKVQAQEFGDQLSSQKNDG
jgi:hypothetical protein